MKHKWWVRKFKWYYMYLTKLLVECQEQQKRQEILGIIENGSVIVCQHANLYGEYDFTKIDLSVSNFDLQELLRFEVDKEQNYKKMAL